MVFEQIVAYIVIGTVLIVILNQVYKMLSDLTDCVKDKITEQKIKNQAKEYMKKKINEEKKHIVDKFYGLFELILTANSDTSSIRESYYDIIRQKLKSKYETIIIRPQPEDKIFFIYNNFLVLENLVRDFVKLYQHFNSISKKKNIKLDLKFSIWTKSGEIANNTALKILTEINNLQYINKVISNDEIYIQYQKQKAKSLDFQPCGVIRLIENDEEIELYRLMLKNNE